MGKQADPLDTFKEEAAELLDIIESRLISLEDEPDNKELIDSCFRSLHTIKGSGNMFDLDRLVHFTHKVENVFSQIRDGRLKVNKEIIDLTLHAKDTIRAFLFNLEDDEAVWQEAQPVLTAFDKYTDSDAPASGTAKAGRPAPPEQQEEKEEGPQKTFRIKFIPSEDFFKIGANPLLLIKELKELGDVLVIGGAEGVPPLDEMDEENCYYHWDLILTTKKDENAIRDIFIFVEDNSEIEISEIDSETISDTDINYKRLGEILVDRGDITRNDLEQAVNSRDFLGEVLVDKGIVSSEEVKSALKEQQFVRKMRETRMNTEVSSTIKVKTEKLDSLVNLVGEFVSMHASIAQLSEKKEDYDFISLSEQMESLVRDIRDLSMEMHMVPIDILFSGYRRLVRDLSEDLGKEINLVLEGTDTELDKNVIDQLKDPLMHIIRNSIDHGIESPEQRKKAGKKASGTIVLSAFYSGANVIIQIKDDGAGLNAERIRKKAIERGIISGDADLSQEEIHSLIFEPGFSTAEKATNVSGRGVGMDVVKRNIEQLNGAVRISSTAKEGTTIRIRIPLTLAIIEGLLARIGDEHYMINISYIVECLDFTEQDRDSKQRIINYRGEVVPYIDLRKYFRMEENKSPFPQLVIVAVEETKIGLIVDEIKDKYQTVIKSLGKLFENAQGVSGAVILGDGTLALMLDVDHMVRLSDRKSTMKMSIDHKGQ
jgi:two-component system chemotaxis sensor kinase CheA